MMTTAMTYLRIPHLRRGLVLALIGGGLAAFGWTQSLQPARAAYEAARADAVGRAAEAAALDARRALAGRFETSAQEVEALDAALSAAADRSQLVERMTGLSAEAGTRIVHGSNTLGEPRGGLRPLLQDITVEGSYAQVRAFMAAVAGLETLTILVSVDLSANPDGTLVRGRMRFMTLAEATG